MNRTLRPLLFVLVLTLLIPLFLAFPSACARRQENQPTLPGTETPTSEGNEPTTTSAGGGEITLTQTGQTSGITGGSTESTSGNQPGSSGPQTLTTTPPNQPGGQTTTGTGQTTTTTGKTTTTTSKSTANTTTKSTGFQTTTTTKPPYSQTTTKPTYSMTTTTSQLTAPSMIIQPTTASLLLGLINDERIRLGRPELRPRPYLANPAIIRVGEITQIFDHVRLDGSPWHTVLSQSYAVKEELIARGKSLNGAQAAYNYFMSRPADKAKLLSADYNVCGFALGKLSNDPSGYEFYWVLLLAHD